MAKNKCGKCGSNKIIETISGGIIQKVWWDGDFIIKGETTYEKTNKYSEFECEYCHEKIL